MFFSYKEEVPLSAKRMTVGASDRDMALTCDPLGPERCSGDLQVQVVGVGTRGGAWAVTDAHPSALPAGEKVLQDDEFTCDLFRFLQLLCEGHNSGL